MAASWRATEDQPTLILALTSVLIIFGHFINSLTIQSSCDAVMQATSRDNSQGSVWFISLKTEQRSSSPSTLLMTPTSAFTPRASEFGNFLDRTRITETR